MTSSAPASQDPNDIPKYWIRPYYSSFNGLRGAAVCSVFLHHYSDLWNADKLHAVSWAGVDLFFVLSGFLITGILYDSLDSSHFFRNFYVRRSLRIFPAYYVLFLLLFLLKVPLQLRYHWTLLTFTLYVGNLFLPFLDISRQNPTVIAVFRHNTLMEVANIGPLWSLCVEEQFYLIWPSVIWFVRGSKQLLWICATLCLIAPFERYLITKHIDLSTHTLIMHWSTYTRYDTLLIGAVLALWLRRHPLSTAQLRRVSFYLFWVPFLALVAGITHYCHGFNIDSILGSGFVVTAGYSLIALSCAGIVLRSLDETSLLSRAMRFKPLAALGTISYGFYLIHALPKDGLMIAAQHYPGMFPWIPVIAFLFTVTVATLSFRYFETPFLRLKRRLAPQDVPHSPDGAMNPVRLHVEQPGA